MACGKSGKMNIKKQQENIDKGNEAEKLFSEYLNSQSIPFYRVDQKKRNIFW
jgi:hypothetical protein